MPGHVTVISRPSDKMEIEQSYTMNLYPRTLYGNKLNRVKYLGMVAAKQTRLYGIIAQEEHDKVFSQLPAGTPNDPTKYGWLIFEDVNGNELIIGEAWVDNATVEGNTPETTYTYRIKGDGRIPVRVKYALNSIGINDFELIL